MEVLLTRKKKKRKEKKRNLPRINLEKFTKEDQKSNGGVRGGRKRKHNRQSPEI